MFLRYAQITWVICIWAVFFTLPITDRFNGNFNDLSNPIREFQGVCERNLGCKSCCHVLLHPRYSIFTSTSSFTDAIPQRSKVLSYILYDACITTCRTGEEFSLEGKRERGQMQCCQYIMGDRDRFDHQGLSETGLSSSISNLFVSAVILTDKQSACNITLTLTECDSASTRHEKMAPSEWIRNENKSIQQAQPTKTLFAETGLSKI